MKSFKELLLEKTYTIAGLRDVLKSKYYKDFLYFKDPKSLKAVVNNKMDEVKEIKDENERKITESVLAYTKKYAKDIIDKNLDKNIVSIKGYLSPSKLFPKIFK